MEMKRGLKWMMSAFIITGLLLTGCNAAQPAASTATTAFTVAAPAGGRRTFAANETPGQGGPNGPGGQGAPGGQIGADGTPLAQPRGTRVLPATATATPTVTATAVPATKAATSTTAPYNKFATVTPGVAGRIPVPEKRTTVTFPQNTNFYVVTTALAGDSSAAYQFTAVSGQTLHVVVNDVRSVNVQVFGPSLNPLSQKVAMPGRLNVLLTESGTHYVVMNGLGDATLSLYLAGPNDNPASGAPLTGVIQTVELPVVPYSITLPTKLDPTVAQGYAFNAQGGQALTLDLTGSLTITVVAPDGNTLIPDIDAFDHKWHFYLPESGQYRMIFLGTGAVSVTARITVPSETVLPAAKVGNAPVTLTNANPSLAFSTSFVANQEQAYPIHLESGQSFSVNVTGTAGVVKFTNSANTAPVMTHTDWSDRWSTVIQQAGDYTVVLGGNGPSLVTFTVR
jgi:hypothetical protein